jgi:hypothetical protein
VKEGGKPSKLAFLLLFFFFFFFFSILFNYATYFTFRFCRVHLEEELEMETARAEWGKCTGMDRRRRRPCNGHTSVRPSREHSKWNHLFSPLLGDFISLFLLFFRPDLTIEMDVDFGIVADCTFGFMTALRLIALLFLIRSTRRTTTVTYSRYRSHRGVAYLSLLTAPRASNPLSRELSLQKDLTFDLRLRGGGKNEHLQNIHFEPDGITIPRFKHP